MINKPGVEATGSLMQWLVVHAALPAEEERRRADEELNKAREQFKPAEAPSAAQKVFDELIAVLPAMCQYSPPCCSIKLCIRAHSNGIKT